MAKKPAGAGTVKIFYKITVPASPPLCWYATNRRVEAEYMATPAGVLEEDKHDVLRLVDFTHCPHVVEEVNLIIEVCQ